MRASHKKALWISGIILLVLLLLSGLAFGITKYYLNQINRVDDSDTTIIDPADQDFETDSSEPGGEEEAEKPVLDPEDIHWGAAEALPDGDLINLLLVGQDRREGQGRQRSDTMILLSVNPQTRQVSLISFLRDLYVQIPGGYADNRLNAAYAFGGFPLMNETFRHNFGITIDGNIEVDFERFIQIVDILGGVDIELTAAEAAHLGSWAVEGRNHLNGDQALQYARIRAIDSDFNRTQRQRKILLSIFQTFKNADFATLLSLMNTLLPSLTTNLTDGEILSLSSTLFPVLSSATIQSYRVPADNAYYAAKIRGMSVLVPDLQKIRTQLKNEYLPFSR